VLLLLLLEHVLLLLLLLLGHVLLVALQQLLSQVQRHSLISTIHLHLQWPALHE
jgi:hypothetical protein